MGIVALPILAAIAWLVISGWRDFYWIGRGQSRSKIDFLWFVPLAAAVSACALAISVVLLSRLELDIYSFSLYLAALHATILWIASIAGSLMREKRNAFSNACRVGAAFLLIFVGLAEPMARSLGMRMIGV